MMHTHIDAKVDTETGCGRPLEDWLVSFKVTWAYDYDEGWTAEARMTEAYLGNLKLTRDMAIEVCGEAAVDRFEREAAQIFADNWREYQMEAAE